MLEAIREYEPAGNYVPIFVPESYRDQREMRHYQIAREYFDLTTFGSNMEILRFAEKVFALAGKNKVIDINTKRSAQVLLAPYLQDIDYRLLVTHLVNSPNYTQTLEDNLGVYLPSFQGGTNEQISYFMAAAMLQQNDVVGITPAHNGTYAEIHALVNLGVPIEEIGLIVYDRHWDTYLHDNPDISNSVENELVLKPNFNYHLLREGIGGIGIIGIPKSELQGIKAAYRSNRPDDELSSFDLTAKYGIAPFLDRRLFALPLDQMQMNNGQFKQSSFNRKLESIISQMMANGVKYIFTSVDLDVTDMLREGITVPEYSPFNQLLGLGIRDFSRPFSPNSFLAGEDQIYLLKMLEKTKQNIDEYRGLLRDKRISQQFKQSRKAKLQEGIRHLVGGMTSDLQDLTSIKPFLARMFKNEQELLLGRLTTLGGLRINTLRQALSSQMNMITEIQGISKGIPIIPTGKTVFGDVAEFEEVDQDGNSAKLTAELMDIMAFSH